MSSAPTKRTSRWPSWFRNTFILFIVLGVICPPLFYWEEDRSGARELAAAEVRWQAAGLSLTPSDYYPPPVPDDQNLAALPLFDLAPAPKNSGQIGCLKLRAATDSDQHGGSLSDYNKKTDLAELVAKAYGTQFPGKTPPASSLAQLEELYPFVADLRTAAKTRPVFRLNEDYAHQPAIGRSLGPLTDQIRVAKILSFDAQLALKENQQQVALDDVTCALQIARGVGTDPSLVGGLVAIGINAIMRQRIDGGLSQHEWNDSSLAQLQDELKKTNYLTIFQFDMRGEAVVNELPMYKWLKTRPNSMSLIYGMSDPGPPEEHSAANLLKYLWADGWWDMNAAQSADVMLDCVESVDPKLGLVHPERLGQLEQRVESVKSLPGPWNILFGVSAGPIMRGMEKFAQAQVQMDEDRIVCGLERYRLSHGAYPATLDALVPTCIDEVPHDVMDGSAFHYRLTSDGTFQLYSVGWNQTDDGGKVVYKQDNPKAIDYEQGDWVWPMVKR